MEPSQAVGRSETDASHRISMSLGPAAFGPAPGVEICRDLRRSLVLLQQPSRTNLAPGGRKLPTIAPHTISSLKTILPLAWDPHRFRAVSILPKGQKWTS
jgi:hypothetical protein